MKFFKIQLVNFAQAKSLKSILSLLLLFIFTQVGISNSTSIIHQVNENITVLENQTNPTNTQKGKTLFIYFNGSGKPLNHQLTQFATMIKADVQIYVNGVGKQTKDKVKSLPHSMIFKEKEERIAEYSDQFWGAKLKNKTDVIELNNMINPNSHRKIYGINRQYNGDVATGYSYGDSYTVVLDVFEVIKRYSLEEFETITISGHSRGAAVAIPSLLFAFKEIDCESCPKFLKYQKSIKKLLDKAKIINVIALDPVAGAENKEEDADNYGDLNNYHMSSWDMPEVYEYLNKKYNIYFSEVYANAARMSDKLRYIKEMGYVSFNPALRYLKRNSGVDVHRFWLGFRHSSMVNTNELYSNQYVLRTAKKPNALMADYINASFENHSLFRDKSHWTKSFYQNDKAGWEGVKAMSATNAGYEVKEIKRYVKFRHRTFINFEQEQINMSDFIGTNGIEDLIKE